MKKSLTALFLLIAALTLALGLFGLFAGLRLAYLPLLTGCGFAALAALVRPASRRFPHAYRVCASAAASLCVLALLAGAAASAQILSCYFDEPAPENSVLIVLGCGLSPEDQTSPSLMLALRLRAAERYLAAHPDSICVLSGGRGPGERISEAQAMYNTLAGWGVDPERLLLEEQSGSTRQNLEFSARLLRERGIDADDTVIVTDGFHEFRAHTLARRLGLRPYTAASHAPISLTAFYWARELAGVVAQCWLGL